MSCGSCGHKEGSSLPAGCRDHGSCRSGGCNRLNVHDWLSLIPTASFSKPFPFAEVSFNHGSRKEFYKISQPHLYEKGDFVTVEGSSGGYDVGVISLTGELVKLQMKRKGISEKSEEIKRIMRASHESEISRLHEVKQGEPEILIRSRVMARELKLDMKIAEVELQADGKKATFFYTAEDRVDFRELIKRYANDFKVKVEMRQIGIRQEAAKIGGIGSCGRELCCSTWLNDFKSVGTTAARYQNLSINQTKLSGQCGRLKCCLNYELDTYMDALRVFPENAERIRTSVGTASLQKRDIFRNLMWYSYEKSNTLYPLTIERVKEIMDLNRQGVFPDELQAVEVVKKTQIAEKTDFVDVVGQLSLRSLDKNKKKKKNPSSQGGNNQPNKAPRQTPADKEGGGQRNPNPSSRKPAQDGQGRQNPRNQPANGAPKNQQQESGNKANNQARQNQQKQRRDQRPRNPKEGTNTNRESNQKPEA